MKGRPPTRELGKATGLLAGAVLLALVAEQFYQYRLVVASIVAAAVALVLCCYVAYLSAPHVVRWSRLRGLNLPWSYRITREGLAFVVAVLVVGGAAVVSGNNLLYLVLSSMMAAMLLSGLVSRLGLSGLQLHLSFPDHIFAGQAVLARVAIRNLKRWFPSFSVWISAAPRLRGDAGMTLEEAYCPMIASRRELVASVQARFPRRGLYRHEAIWLRTKFPFSFVERRARLALPQEILVFPSVEPTAEIEEVLRRLEQQWQGRTRGDSHDLYRIRPALDGDGARFVDWKASARAGGLWVREFTRDDNRRVHIVFERGVPASEGKARFDRSVKLCAAFAWRIHAMNAAIRFTSDDCSISSAPNSGGIYEILRYLALTKPLPATHSRALSPSHSTGPAAGDYFVVTFAATPEPETSTLETSEGQFFLIEK